MDLDELLEEFNASKNMGHKPPPKDWDTSSSPQNKENKFKSLSVSHQSGIINHITIVQETKH